MLPVNITFYSSRLEQSIYCSWHFEEYVDLIADISSSEFFPQSYSVVRCDRGFESYGLTWGGVLLCRDCFSLKHTDTTILRSRLLHIAIGCKCIFHFDYVYVFGVYAPESPTADEIEILPSFFIHHYPTYEKLIIMGDFNMPEFTVGSNSS